MIIYLYAAEFIQGKAAYSQSVMKDRSNAVFWNASIAVQCLCKHITGLGGGAGWCTVVCGSVWWCEWCVV